MARPKRTAECHPDRPHVAHGLCQQCYHKQHYEKNRERILESNSKWTEKNKKRISEQKHRYYIENREDILSRCAKYKEEHKEDSREWQRKYFIENREYIMKQRRERRMKNPNRTREKDWGYNLKHKYGITVEDYDEMLESQDNGCAICGKTPEENGRRLHVDHDHRTGKVRGLLCHACNMLIGFAYDDIDILLNTINYLRDNDAT